MTSSRSAAKTPPHVHVSKAIEKLGDTDQFLAHVLAGLAAVIAEEAGQDANFRAKLNMLVGDASGRSMIAAPIDSSDPKTVQASKVSPAKAKPKRRRRDPGPWDPYVVYAEVGEVGLRDRLSQLELEQLRDIVAEHGMNTDGLAMRWTKAERVIGRIVERVVDRAAKGDAFRNA